ncbi:MAG TPA: hypothetical protein VFZ98_06215 [Vicinamibacterales bacterium]
MQTRALDSSDHYVGTVEQVQRHTLGTYVINKQRAAELNYTRTLTERFGVSVGIPYIDSSWAIPTPTSPVPGPRAPEYGRGLGDITVTGQFWVLPTDRYRKGNLSVGVGVKTPTGNSNYQSVCPDRNGNDPQLRSSDISVQPGDGGWAIPMNAFGFRRIPHGQLFATYSYQLSLTDKNTTPSGSVSRLPTGVTPSGNPDLWANGITDQYLARMGGAFPVKWGIAASAAWRAEGVPRYNLVTGSHGFRRPGVEMFIEPGVTYARGSHVLGFQVPLAYYRNRFPNPYTGSAGDATFPKRIWLVNYSYRFGGKAPISSAICQ